MVNGSYRFDDNGDDDDDDDDDGDDDDDKIKCRYCHKYHKING